ncbi:MAG: TetR/AcrR family transcriptional regulator [bacterium]|nr:TetR/AcrR family transcriptional regulator [bacterium]
MPKVIENLRETLLQEARKEMFEEGYQTFNIRQVAARCQVAVGTVYNYFPSKEMLAATIILEDWMKSLRQMKQKTKEETDLETGLEIIYQELLAFEQLYHQIFISSTAIYSKYGSRKRHQKLREQLEQPIKQVVLQTKGETDPFIITFIAENLLGASQERTEFKKLAGILMKILS